MKVPKGVILGTAKEIRKKADQKIKEYEKLYKKTNDPTYLEKINEIKYSPSKVYFDELKQSFKRVTKPEFWFGETFYMCWKLWRNK